MRKIVAIVFLFAMQFVSAGNLDSLLKVVGGHKADSTYVMLLTNIAGNYEDRGDYDKAILYGKRGKVIADSLHYKFGQQSALNTLGNSYLDKGEVKKALECHIGVLKLREELGVKLGIAYTYLNLGNIYFRIGQDDDAQTNYELAMKILYEAGDTLRVATCLSNIGSIYSNKQKIKESEENYLRALAIHKRYKNAVGIAETYSNLSIIMMDAQKYKQALDYAFLTIPLYGESGSKLGKAISYSNIGDIYEHMGDLNNAIKYQEMSLTLAKEMGTSYMLETCYQLLASAYSKKNDYKNAVRYAELFSGIRDSVMSSENSKQISEMQTRFETGKKEKEIELLQKNKNIRDLEISKQESRLHRQRIVIYTVIGGLLLVIALVSLILRSNSQRKKINLGLERKNSEIELQKSLIEEKNKMIMDSIDYARTIQNAILPPDEKVKAQFPLSFISFLPKEIVSGDFYWLHASSNSSNGGEKSATDSCLFAVVDCVGQGVPGAFMSVMVNSMLENCVVGNGITQPGLILDELNSVIKELNIKADANGIKYGLDISIISYNSKKMELHFAGTKMPLLIMRDNKTLTLNSDSISIGAATNKYKSEKISLLKGDMLYLFTDGILHYTEFIETLPSLASQNISEQKQSIRQKIESKGSQADDVLVVGIRI